MKWSSFAPYKFFSQFRQCYLGLACEQALRATLATLAEGREKEGELQLRLWNLNSAPNSPVAPRRLNC